MVRQEWHSRRSLHKGQRMTSLLFRVSPAFKVSAPEKGSSWFSLACSDPYSSPP